MSQIVYRGNLSTKAFPFLTDFQGRTVIVPGPDNTFNRSLTSSEDLDRDVGVPIAYYCHNVLPAPYGFNSIGYESVVNSVTDGSNEFTSTRLIRSNPISPSVQGPSVYYASRPAAAYKLGIGDVFWVGVISSVPHLATQKESFATVQGITYIHYEGIGAYKYDNPTQALIPVSLSGLVPADIIGVVASQGYLVAYSQSTVYWSSTLDIDYTLNLVDFAPSLTTGAGSIIPEGLKGPIRFLTATTFGFLIFTSSNIVSATYSGNVRYPFNFRELVNSGGCQSEELVAYDANSNALYVYTTSGIQLINQTGTQTVMPEVTDFLAGQDFEDFNEATRQFSLTVLTLPMVKKLATVSDRYLIISYGVSSLTHAIVYDMAQRRYGKLKTPHTDCFEFEYLDPTLADAPRKSIAFLKPSGAVQVVNPSVTFSQSSGVILLGKFQYARSRLLTLEGLVLQTVHTNQTVAVYNLASESGGTIESVVEYPAYEVSLSGQSQRKYEFHVTATNHSILLIGGFFLSSFVLNFHVSGRR